MYMLDQVGWARVDNARSGLGRIGQGRFRET
jgi:hypothetical protein